MKRANFSPRCRSRVNSRIFSNISEVMDCISCQKCKLHGKLQLLGLGTALRFCSCRKIFWIPLNKQEVVALINTIAKFSHAIRKVPDLMNSARQEALQSSCQGPGAISTVNEDGTASNPLDAAISALATHVKSGVLATELEDAIMGALLEDDPKISVLAKYYPEHAAEICRTLASSARKPPPPRRR